MPKLNNLQLAERIRQRIAQLEADEEIAAKDVRALLTDAQHTELEAAWQHQQQLRKSKRAVTEAQQKALGWKSKRELRVEAFKQAVAELEQSTLVTLKDLQQKSEVRRSRIYLDTYFAERDKAATKHQAEGRANNALTRAALARLDRTAVDRASPRDQQVREMEQRLRKQLGLDSEGSDKVEDE
jgi:hypothetical protein